MTETRRRKRKLSFDKLPVSVSAGNAEEFVRETVPKLVERVARERMRRGWSVDDCRGVW